MKNIEFDWDNSKASANKTKHGINFEEAKSAFFDENALVIHDPEHSMDEDRFILLGLSDMARLLVVCHCYRKQDSILELYLPENRPKKKLNNIMVNDYKKI